MRRWVVLALALTASACSNEPGPDTSAQSNAVAVLSPAPVKVSGPVNLVCRWIEQGKPSSIEMQLNEEHGRATWKWPDYNDIITNEARFTENYVQVGMMTIDRRTLEIVRRYTADQQAMLGVPAEIRGKCELTEGKRAF